MPGQLLDIAQAAAGFSDLSGSGRAIFGHQSDMETPEAREASGVVAKQLV